MEEAAVVQRPSCHGIHIFAGWFGAIVHGSTFCFLFDFVLTRSSEKVKEDPLPSVDNLDQVLPEFPEECAIRMDPSPDTTLSITRVLSLAVSLADVGRVRDFLVNGGSARTPVIIARGINGTPLEAICANCPASSSRKKVSTSNFLFDEFVNFFFPFLFFLPR